MTTEFPQVSLTINLEGSHKPRFVFDKTKKNKDGSRGGMVRYYGRVVKHAQSGNDVFIPAYPGQTKAFKKMILNEEFVENAIKSPVRGFKPQRWRMLPKKDRVNKHVRNLVKDMYDLEEIDHTVYQWDFTSELIN